jgi:ribonuclease Z
MESPVTILQERYFHIDAFPLQHSVPTYGFLIVEEPPLLNLRPKMRDKYQMTNDDCIRVKNGEDLRLVDGTVVANADLTLPRRKQRKYAYCCDTAFDESLVDTVAGVDMLCMESTFDNAFCAMAEERRHCTAQQAATIAAQAGVRQLLLTHFSARYRDIEPLLNEARSVFQSTICASDGTFYEITSQIKTS